MVNIEYANAYREVLELLNYISQEDYDKIPKSKIQLFETNQNKNYKFIYDANKTLDEQNVSKKAKTIIAILFRDYWATDAQRKKIKAKEKYDREMLEQKNREKYNPNNIFNNKVSTNKYSTDTNLPVKISDDNIIRKLLKFIKKFW